MSDPRVVGLDLMTQVCFQVLGRPYPQGSKSAFVARNGRAQMKESSGTNHAAWRNAIAQAAKDVRSTIPATLDGPLELTVTFRFDMPKARSKADRTAGVIAKTTAPDLSKLVRALEDGLQAGGLIAEDSRIVRLSAVKVEVHDSWVGADIVIGPLRKAIA